MMTFVPAFFVGIVRDAFLLSLRFMMDNGLMVFRSGSYTRNGSTTSHTILGGRLLDFICSGRATEPAGLFYVHDFCFFFFLCNSSSTIISRLASPIRAVQ